jgi:DNA-binding transcriptional regulator GbsR (MarR family)
MKVDKSVEVKRALEEALNSSESKDADFLVEAVLKTLDKQKVFRYHNENAINLISTAGRVLIALMEDPTMTQRALSVYLDLSETMIDKTVKLLIQNNFITKTKTQRQNIYKVNIEEVKKHPDIQHLKEAISGLFGVTSVKSGGKNVEESVF